MVIGDWRKMEKPYHCESMQHENLYQHDGKMSLGGQELIRVKCMQPDFTFVAAPQQSAVRWGSFQECTGSQAKQVEVRQLYCHPSAVPSGVPSNVRLI